MARDLGERTSRQAGPMMVELKPRRPTGVAYSQFVGHLVQKKTLHLGLGGMS
jgi:hypothetical protein